MVFYDFLAIGGSEYSGPQLIFVMDVTWDDRAGVKLTYVNGANLEPNFFFLDSDSLDYFREFIRNNDVCSLKGRFFRLDFEFGSNEPDAELYGSYYDVDDGQCVGVIFRGVTEITAE